jgi:Zn-dependent protease
MFRSWKLGRLFGINVFVHPTFLLLLAWVLVSSLGEGVAMALTLVALAVAVFGCVLLHEFGHALMARHFGIRTRDITLYPIGGLARLEGMGRRPVEELCIALAGPAVNVALCAVLGVALAALDAGQALLTADRAAAPPGAVFLFHLLLANGLLALFNMVPAFPMDGGRVLRSLLALRLSRLRATEIAVAVGVAFALLIATLLPAVLYLVADTFNPVPILVGLFVFYAGQCELRAVRRAEEEPLDVLPVEPELPEVLPAEPELPPRLGPGPGPVWRIAAPRPDPAE